MRCVQGLQNEANKTKSDKKIHQGKHENHVIIKITGMENTTVSQRGGTLGNSDERKKHRIIR